MKSFLFGENVSQPFSNELMEESLQRVCQRRIGIAALCKELLFHECHFESLEREAGQMEMLLNYGFYAAAATDCIATS